MKRFDDKTHTSADEWDALRTSSIQNAGGVCVGIIAKARNVARAAHWIALACFIEEIDPQQLALHPDTLDRVRGNLAQLESLDRLDAYVAALESLGSESRKAADE